MPVWLMEDGVGISEEIGIKPAYKIIPKWYTNPLLIYESMYTTNPLKPHKRLALVFKHSLPVLYLFMYDWPLYGVYLGLKR